MPRWAPPKSRVPHSWQYTLRACQPRSIQGHCKLPANRGIQTTSEIEKWSGNERRLKTSPSLLFFKGGCAAGASCTNWLIYSQCSFFKVICSKIKNRMPVNSMKERVRFHIFCAVDAWTKSLWRVGLEELKQIWVNHNQILLKKSTATANLSLLM